MVRLLSPARWPILIAKPDYRGHWCPFCIAHLKELVAISDDIKAAGGVVVAATAEAAEHVGKVRSSTGFADTVIVDPENLLARELRSRKLLDVAITDSQLYRLRGYTHGMAQPALLVVNRDGTVLQRWAIVPSLVGALSPEIGRTVKLTIGDEHWWCHGQACTGRGVEEHKKAAARPGHYHPAGVYNHRGPASSRTEAPGMVDPYCVPLLKR